MAKYNRLLYTICVLHSWRLILLDKDLRFKIISEGSTNGVSETCKKYNVSRTLYYRWLNRYKAKGVEGLRVGKKNFVPSNKTNIELENAVLNLIKKYPTYGPKSIKYLSDDAGYIISESAVFNIMKRHNLTNRRDRIIYNKKQERKIIEDTPNLAEVRSGQIWLFWITDYGFYTNVGHIYEYTLFDYKSRIACSRLYNEINFNNFEDILTSTAMPIAKTLNMKVTYLCLFDDCKIFNIPKKIFNTNINNILEDTGFDFRIHVFDDKNEKLPQINELKELYTEGCSRFLIPLVNTNINFLMLRLKFQEYVRNYNITYNTKFDDGDYTPVEYHNKLTNTKLILPIWAYINREY